MIEHLCVMMFLILYVILQENSFLIADRIGVRRYFTYTLFTDAPFANGRDG